MNEKEFIENQLMIELQQTKPLIQKEDYKEMTKIIKKEGKIIAGGTAYASLYYIGYLETLWVAEDHRNRGLGTIVLRELEEKLKEYGCETVHLDTFDFQAPQFYQSNDYQIFGQLHHEQAGIIEYFLTKKLI